MISLEPEMKPEDIGQWVRNGWFYYRPNTSLPPDHSIGTLLHWKEHENDHYVIADIDGNSHASYPDVQDLIFPHWPDLGSINIPGMTTAVYLSRIQLKQWRRTYNERQVRVFLPRKWEMIKVNPMLMQLSANHKELVKAVFKPVYPTIEEARQWFESGWTVIALSPTVLVTNTTPRLVYFRGKTCAAIGNYGKVEVLDERLWARVEKQFPGGINI